MKEFIIKFLNIEERHYADTLISMRMCEDLISAYHEAKKREEKPEDYFGRNEKMVTGNSSVNVGYNQQNSSIA